jgi:hypothetical protein
MCTTRCRGGARWEIHHCTPSSGWPTDLIGGDGAQEQMAREKTSLGQLGLPNEWRCERPWWIFLFEYSF